MKLRVLILLASLLSFPIVTTSGQVVHTVHPDDSIQVVLDLATDGDTVLFTTGVYQQAVLKVNRSVVLMGEPEAVLDGSAGHGLLEIYVDNVTVENLIFRNVPRTFVDDRSAVRVESAAGCVIKNNLFNNTFFALYLANVDGCLVSNNTMTAFAERESSGGNAIHSWYSKNLEISGNVITGHRDGIYLEFTEDSRVTNNRAQDNLRYGLHFMFSDRCDYEGNTFASNGAGVAVMYADEIDMIGNEFLDAWGPSSYGLLLKEIKGGEVRGNTFDGNSVALLVEGSDRLAFDANVFSNNGWGLKLMANSTANTFTGNVFQSNTFDVATNSLSAPSTFSGNYWDRYRGYDLDRDGVGDVPFRPVRLFSVIVERYEASLVLMHSVLVDVLDTAERIMPALTPAELVDASPLMKRPI